MYLINLPFAKIIHFPIPLSIPDYNIYNNNNNNNNNTNLKVLAKENYLPSSVT